MTASRYAWLLMTVILTIVTGCSGGGSSGPKVVAARGKVTYKNLPVEGAIVSFLGDGKTAPAMGTTDSKGEFVLTTVRAYDGAIAGVHRVTVSKVVGPPPSSTKPMSMEEAAKAANSGPPAKPTSMLPERYASADSSGLQFEVKQGDKNDFAIDLID